MTPLSHWLWFHAAVVVLMLAEFGLHKLFPDPRRKAIWATVLWTTAALALAVVLVPRYRGIGATQYLAGYAIEEALSVDNLFVFLLLFRLFHVPAIRQPKVLFWGVAGAIVMRGAFIAGGIGLLNRFHWIEYIFGAILLIAAIRLIKPEPDAETGETPAWIRWLTRLHPVSERCDVFMAREAVPQNQPRLGVPDPEPARTGAPGPDSRTRVQPPKLVLMPTMLLLALIAVELTDVVFALDSIPAVLSITRIPFLAYTSNIMAVMGLRSLYVLLAAMLKQLRYMHLGLAAVLAFAAIKMLAADWITVGPIASLIVIASLLGTTIGVSLLHKPAEA